MKKSVISFAVALVFLSLPSCLFANDRIPGPVFGVVTEVVDGDTVKVDAKPWPGTVMQVSVRLNGIDTPQIRGRCDFEKEAAQVARRRLADLAPPGTPVRLENIAHDKYAGRVDANLFLPDGVNPAVTLLNEGLGRPYDGGTRQGWCGATATP